MTQKILLSISSFEAAAIGVADEPRRVEHEDHALRVVQDVAIEIALAAIAALGLAAVRDVFEDVDRALILLFAAMNPRSGNEICPLAGGMHKLFLRHLRVPAERTPLGLRRRTE